MTYRLFCKHCRARISMANIIAFGSAACTTCHYTDAMRRRQHVLQHLADGTERPLREVAGDMEATSACLASGWIARIARARTVRITPKGRSALQVLITRGA